MHSIRIQLKINSENSNVCFKFKMRNNTRFHLSGEYEQKKQGIKFFFKTKYTRLGVTLLLTKMDGIDKIKKKKS